MERLLTGRRIGLSFAIDENAFVLVRPDQRRRSARPAAPAHPQAHPSALGPDPARPLPRRRGRELRPPFLLGRGAGGARAGRRDPPQRPEMAADREGRDAGGDGRAVPRLLRARCSPRGRSMRSSSATSSSRPRSRRCGARSAPCRGGPRRGVPAGAGRCSPPAPNPEPRTFTHQGDPNQAYALIGWSTIGGDRADPASGARWRSPPTCSRRGCSTGCASRRAPPTRPTPSHLAADSFPDWGVLYAAAEIRPASAATFFRIAREIVADLAAQSRSARRVRAGAQSGAERDRAAARDQRLLDRRARGLGPAIRVQSRMSAPILPIIGR